jgi:hypothetical protein
MPAYRLLFPADPAAQAFSLVRHEQVGHVVAALLPNAPQILR